MKFFTILLYSLFLFLAFAVDRLTFFEYETENCSNKPNFSTIIQDDTCIEEPY